MLSTAIVVFREVLEAALVIGIVLAATQEMPYRRFWVSLGFMGGLAGAGLVALFAGTIAQAAFGMGQELFNALVLSLAVCMLGWHTVWMSHHVQQLSVQVRALRQAIVEEAGAAKMLALFIALAILREGSEVVLFLYGLSVESGGALNLLLGGLIGLALGVLVGLFLYLGILRFSTKHLFTVTSWMILLLAAGMASQAANYLVQADWLNPLYTNVWDSSAILPEGSLLGGVLHTLIGYEDRPSALQILVYFTTLGTLILLMKGVQKKDAKKSKAALGASL